LSDVTSVGGPLTDAQRASWAERGSFVLPGFADAATCRAMHERAVELCRMEAAGESIRHSLVDPERNPWADAREPEDRVSKVFILHDWDPVFGPFARDPRLVGVLGELLGPDIDCFLSQFIFKNPGAIGQPWHQDSLYFPFEPADQVGIWLAVTAATETNGPLSVLPGSHTEPVHEHVADQRPDANLGYTEIVDMDFSGAERVLMDAGDLLVFDSHLMHCSSDNVSDGRRAAMVYHYARAGTVDHTYARLREQQDAMGEMPDEVKAAAEAGDAESPYHWMPVRRGGAVVGAT
jgi:ectoine hydroxylase-related dioxygenase (phytanoyl-CoA dioxygenase family)